MIAKRVDRGTNDSFKRLAEYIAAAKDKGEKLDDFWLVNCKAGSGIEDLDLAIVEVEAKQSRNRRAKGDKSYHLIVSFRDEKPSPEALREIEAAFAKALGFEDHQRVVGTHQNTGNFHMHVAYNKVHPETLRNVSPSWDFKALERTCRQMEKRFGLKIDRGRADKPEKDRVNWRARDYEAQTWQESLQSYIEREKKALDKAREAAGTWDELHAAMAARGLVLKPRGAGMVIATLDGEQAVKASSLGRAWSAEKLKKRFGAYKAPENAPGAANAHGRGNAATKAQSASTGLPGGARRYRRRPIVRHPNVPLLWRRYSKARDAGLLGTAARTFRQWLMLGAVDDPLAIAVLVYQTKMMNLGGELVGRFQVAAGLAATSAPAMSPFPPAPFAHDTRTPREIWKAAPWADPKTNPYLKSVGLRSFGAREAGDGIMLPIRGLKGNVVNLQFIDRDGRISYAGPEVPVGAYHLIDSMKAIGRAPVLVATTYADAAGLHQATRLPVALPMAPAGLLPVARMLARQHKETKVLLTAAPSNEGIVAAGAGPRDLRIVSSPGQSWHAVAAIEGPTRVRELLGGVAGSVIADLEREFQKTQRQTGVM